MPRQTASVPTPGRTTNSRSGRSLRSKSKSPYADHPLFNLRRTTLLISVIGLILSLVYSSQSYYVDETLFPPAAFLMSILLVQWDFTDWRTDGEQELKGVFDERGEATGWVWEWQRGWMGRMCKVRIVRGRGRARPGRGERVRREEGEAGPSSERSPLLANHRGNGGGRGQHRRRDGDTDANNNSSRDGDDIQPHWPRKAIMICDFTLTLFCGYTYVWIMSEMSYGWYRYSYKVVSTYCSLLVVFTAGLHAKCWWEELMARRKQEWEREQAEEYNDGDGEHEGDAASDTSTDESERDLEAGTHQPNARRDESDDEPVEERQVLKRVLRFLRKNGHGDTADGSKDGDRASADEAEGEDPRARSLIHILTPETSRSDTIVPAAESSRGSDLMDTTGSVHAGTSNADFNADTDADVDVSTTHDSEAVMIKKKKKSKSKSSATKGKENAV